jgi:hypothetical protein
VIIYHNFFTLLLYFPPLSDTYPLSPVKALSKDCPAKDCPERWHVFWSLTPFSVNALCDVLTPLISCFQFTSLVPKLFR